MIESPVIELEHVCHAYTHATSLDDVSLSVAPGETVALIGPSGCGKSTLLKAVIGLVGPSRGRVAVDGVELHASNVLELRRRIGYVIQSGGLFPHLSAVDNITLAARYLRRDAKWIDGRVNELADLVQLRREVLRRYPTNLSGGQRQRVSLMRALMLDPDVLLLDEPLGALDPMVRHGLQEELRALFERLRKTVRARDARHGGGGASSRSGSCSCAQAASCRRARIATWRLARRGVRQRRSSRAQRGAARDARRALRRAASLVRRRRWLAPCRRGRARSSARRSSPSRSSSARSATQLRARLGQRRDAPARARRHARAVERAAARRHRLLPGVHRHAARGDLRAASIADDATAAHALAQAHAWASPPLGFNNTYVLGMRRERARQLGIDADVRARAHPELRLGFSNEFLRARRRLARLARALPAAAAGRARPRVTTSPIAALADGAIDVTDLYSTDAEIAHYDLIALVDDAHYFPGLRGAVRLPRRRRAASARDRSIASPAASMPPR